MWATIDNGTYQHIFIKLEKPFIIMQGELIKWKSICNRSFAIKEPQPNPKKKKCRYCLDKEDGHHVQSPT